MQYAEFYVQQRDVLANIKQYEARLLDLERQVRDRLADLRRAGYAANSHPSKPGYVVISDPVHRSASRGMLELACYEHRTVHVDQVWKFIDDRS
jgi:hypothetical protein